MFDVLLKSKFYSKCKTGMKITKTRIEVIKRKRNAMEKFLKKDIVDLLNNRLDINAYGRAEGLLVELNMSACYDFVTDFCACLLPRVSLMDKQRDCPEDCREAVQSLMYAAARFADLPELRELRAVFVEKYGNVLEASVNSEFVEKLKATPPTKEMKIRLLQDIALESGKNWDSKALEQKLYNPPLSYQALSEDANNKKQTQRKNKVESVKKSNKKASEDHTQKSFPSPPRKTNDRPSYKLEKTNVDRYKIQESESNDIYERDSEKAVTGFKKKEEMNELNLEKPFRNKVTPPPYNKRSSSESKCEPREKLEDAQNNKSRSGKNRHEEKTDEIRHYQRKFAPISYQENSGKTSRGDIQEASSDQKANQNKSNHKTNEHKEKPGEKKSKFDPPAPYTWQKPKAEASLGEEKTQEQDDSADKAKPKPRSVRSVRSIRSIAPPDEGNIRKKDDILDEIRQELATKPGHKITDDLKEEDDKKINELLMHYCRRESPFRGRGLQFRS